MTCSPPPLWAGLQLTSSVSPTIAMCTVNTNNVQFVSDVEEYKNLDSMYLTQAFAVGSVFSMDLLDSLMAAVCISLTSSLFTIKHLYAS